MSIQEWGSLGELIAAIATIATLAFLAVQIRNGTAAARTTAELELSQQFAAWHARAAMQPDLQRIWDEAAIDFGRLGPDEVRRFRWLVAELFLVFESAYFAYRGGFLSEASCNTKVDTIIGLLANPIILEWWEDRFTPFSEEFREHVDAARTGANASWVHRSVSQTGASRAQ